MSGGRFRPQAWPPLSTYQITVWAPSTLPCGRDALSSCNGRQIVCRYSTPPARTAQGATRRHFAIRSQGRVRSARYKDGSSGGAASYYYAAFNAPCVVHKDDESQVQIISDDGWFTWSKTSDSGRVECKNKAITRRDRHQSSGPPNLRRNSKTTV